MPALLFVTWLWLCKTTRSALLCDWLQGIGTLELLQRSFVAPQDIIYVSVGRWHANSCEGVSANLPSILTNIGRFARDNAASLPNFFFSLSPFDHLQCAPNR